MNSFVLLRRNLAHYWRTNLAVVCGVAVAVAVLAGALLVGDSVRASLRELFLQRLGSTEQVLSGASFFREQLASELERDGLRGVCPLIVLRGTVTHEASKRWSSGVQIYGVDERFWRFHGRESATGPRERETLVGASLADELGVQPGDTLLLRVEKPSAIPVESLHGRKEDLGRTVRLTARARLDPTSLGEFSLQPQQTAVKVVFVPLALLQKELEQEGKVNTILLSGQVSNDALRAVVKERVTLEDLGVKLRALDEGRVLALETESALVNNYLSETASATASRLGLRPQPIFSYLANSIRSGPREVPYSLVTAIDDESFEKLKSTAPPSSQPSSSLPPVILNEWAARELGAQPGAPVTLEYYLWQEGGRLTTATAEFQLAGVVPIQGLAADRNLVPEYPGITGSESLSAWDPPFPVDLARVRDRDEEYWDRYGTTPKAFIPLTKGQELWASRFGRLTSLRLLAPMGAPADATLNAYRSNLRAALDPAQAGLALYAARDEGLKAAKGATNFGEYFLYFSFFLVVSALMLAALFFKLGVEQRLRELGILRAVGFHAARIRTLFLVEGIVLATMGSVLGLLGALLYGKLMMLGLTTWWVGAVGTTLLKLHVSPTTLALGGAGGVLAALGCVYWTLRRLAPASPRSLLTGTALTVTESRRASTRTRRPYTLVAAVVSTVAATALLISAGLGVVGQVAGFFGGGALLLIALLCYQSVWLRRPPGRLLGGSGWWTVARLGFRNVAHRPVRSVLCIALIASAAFIIVAVESFRRDGRDQTLDRKSGGGGYPLLAESALPLVHDPNTPEGREALNLNTGQDAAALEGVRFTRFRLRPGDDASCLNLYQPRNPRVLAPTEDFVRENRFSFQNSLARTNEEQANPWLLLNSEQDNGVITVVADANSLSYVLHLKLGDEFQLEREGGGGPVRLRIVGALSDSIFQSELLMSEKNFLRLFPEQEGFRFFLLDLPQPETAATMTQALEKQLSDFGFDVTPTAERLAQFHRVENTFISTFQMLGALGLALGTLGMAAVLLRNVLERRRELALLRAVGYNARHFALMTVAENALLLLCGLLTGTACALLAISPVFFSRGGGLPRFSIGLLLLSVLISGLLASLVATAAALRSPLIPALRSE